MSKALVTNHPSEKQLFSRFSALGVLYWATLVNAQTPLPFEVLWNVGLGYISSLSLLFHISKAKLAFSSLIYGNDEVLLHRHFNLAEYCLPGSLVTYTKIKDINMNKIKSTKMWHSDSYKTSSQISEPTAIIRAALHNRSLCLFIFNFRYLLSILIFGKWGRIRQAVHTFRPLKLSRSYHFNRNINVNVSCRSVN